MANEKLIRSLADLQEAAQQATLHGLCAIRLQDGEKLVLVHPLPALAAEALHDVTDPQEEEVVLSCLRSGGKYYVGDEARAELARRLAARGIQS